MEYYKVLIVKLVKISTGGSGLGCPSYEALYLIGIYLYRFRDIFFEIYYFTLFEISFLRYYFLRYVYTVFEIYRHLFLRYLCWDIFILFLRYIVCEASFFTFRIAFCIMFVTITFILSIYIFMEYFFMDKVTAKRLICLGTWDILYLQLSAFLVDNRDLPLHIFV